MKKTVVNCTDRQYDGQYDGQYDRQYDGNRQYGGWANIQTQILYNTHTNRLKLGIMELQFKDCK